LILDPEHRAGSMRVAFAVKTPAQVDAAARVAARCGARAIEGPGLHPEYGDYYAVFFEDADGNRFEIMADEAAAA
ncbi:MAG: VOC family protein, partial [Candidatus Cybelea sp.]